MPQRVFVAGRRVLCGAGGSVQVQEFHVFHTAQFRWVNKG